MNARGRNTRYLVEKKELTSTATAVTFTLPYADNFDKTSYYELVIVGGVTAALSTYLNFNGNTDSQYYTDGADFGTGATTYQDVNTGSTGVLIDTGFTDTGREIYCISQITLTKGLTLDRIIASSRTATSQGIGINRIQLNVDQTSLTSLELTVSTSSWMSGSKFTLYRINK